MEKITYDEYEKAMVVVYKYLKEKHGSYMDIEEIQREYGETNLLVALAHPHLYLEEKLKS